MMVFYQGIPTNLSVEELAASDLPHACIIETPNPLQDDLQQLENLVVSLSEVESKTAYKEVVRYAGQRMTGH